MSFEKGQKLLYLTIKDGRPHAEVVIFEGGTFFDQYDVISSNVYTKEQILEMFKEKSCVCLSSPPGVALSDGTCGNCGGVVGLDFYNKSMEGRYGLRICPECGHDNRHPNNHCDKCTKPLEPLSKLIKCPRCGKITRRGNRCDNCDSGIPLCYGVVAPRTQDCANCVYTVECLEEQKRPVISPDDRMFPPGTLTHEIELPSDKLIELTKASADAESILCPNCKQPVGDKYEHSGSDYDGISVDLGGRRPVKKTKEEVP